QYERNGQTASPLGTLHVGAARSLLRVRDQLLRTLRQEAEHQPGAAAVDADEALLRSLLAAFPDRLARRREGDRSRGVMVGGKGVRLAPGSGVTEAELFLCIDVDTGAEAWVRQASAVQRDWLPPESVAATIDVSFDSQTEPV